MPRLLYILFLFVITCRLVVLTGPIIHFTTNMLVEWHDQEESGEESKVEKNKYEFKEEQFVPQIELAEISQLGVKFGLLPNSRLLEHTRKPFSPPPNLA